MVSTDTSCEHCSPPADLARIAGILLPSVPEVLEQTFGSDFCEADLDQKLTLVETIVYTLREGGYFHENLMDVICSGEGVDVPDIPVTAPLQVNEGLKLMGALQAAIVEDYSVLRAAETSLGIQAEKISEQSDSDWVDPEPPNQGDREFREECDERLREWSKNLPF
jgi:hypothetical protein